MKRTWRSILSLLLVFAMVLSLGATGFALEEEPEAEAPAEQIAEEPGGSGVGLSFEQVDNDIISERLPLAARAYEEPEPEHADDELVRVSIFLDKPSAIDAGLSPASAGAYRAELRSHQDVMAERISTQALDGAELDVVWNLTLAGNVISANVEYGRIEAICQVPGVQKVVIETRYLPMEDEIENVNAVEMTGATAAWNLGYTGAGSTIAVVDTGLDTDHQSFDALAFEYAIDELDELRDEPIELMTEDDVAAVWDQLNAAKFIGSVDGVYRTAKVPFGVNYVDRDLEITHDFDKQGEHGSHVAGIAAANKYIPSGEGYANALETVLTQGQAPDAQLIIMKVFGAGGGAYDSDYMAAIEDAMTLGCDAVNLSLGSAAPGFVSAGDYEELLNKLADSGLVWCNSAGNSYSWGSYALGRIFRDDVNFHTGGSPGTYTNSLSVASVDNNGSTGYTFSAPDGSKIVYQDGSSANNAPMISAVGQYNYILVLGPGVDDNNGTNDVFAALGPEIMEGKIGICMRGSSSFFAKANAIAAQGAAGAVIFNNTAGTIGMALTGYRYTAPVASITKNDGMLLYELGEEKEYNGVTYYEGTLTVDSLPVTASYGLPVSEYQTMSDFSSWGGNGALTMKPEITAPGGNIWSVNGLIPGGTAYENMSGTSMASPQVAGLTAVLKQYIREEDLAGKLGMTERAIVQSLLMSTAIPLRDPDTGAYWSILKQGAGLADVNKAITARSLIRVTALPGSAPASAYASIADGKVKAEIGQVYNQFSVAFAVTNFSDETISLYLNGSFFTQAIQSYYRLEDTTPIQAHIGWTVNGESYKPASLNLDLNDDGVSNGADAQLLLDWCADDSVEIFNLDLADLDGDGNVDTHDAQLAFEKLNGASIQLAPGATANINAAVGYDMSAYNAVNGNYVEGFLFVREGEADDGAVGVEHSIPVYGFNGNFSDASMYDRGSRLEYTYDFGDSFFGPYMYYASNDAKYLSVETFLVKYAGDLAKYAFGGNPLIDDETYHPERNALNAADVLAGVSFTQIRNAGAMRFFVTDAYDRVVLGSELEGGQRTGAYYYVNQSKWMNTQSEIGVNYKPERAKEGDSLTAHFQLALEYFVNPDGSVRWDELGEGAELSIPFVIDNTAPDIVKVERSTAAPTEESGEEGAEENGEEGSDTLTITAHDNQYIAAVALFTDAGDLLDAQGSVEDILRGKEADYSFDLKEIFQDEEVYPYLLVQVYDYALNLSTFKINFTDELEDPVVESVTVTPGEAMIIGANSLRLSVDVRPWGIDDACEWTSSDESVAVVDENGLVTGVSNGEAVITATSLLDPSKSGTCSITVMFINKDLNGIVWDESGDIWFSSFNLSTIPTYTSFNEEPLRLPIASLAYDETMTLYGVSLNDSSSTLYTVNTDTWEATPVGDGIGDPVVDFCQAPALGGYLYGVIQNYLLIIDKESGQEVGYFDLNNILDEESDVTDVGNIVGITYETIYKHPSYGYCDWLFLLGEDGMLYEAGFLVNNGGIGTFGVYPVDTLGYTTDTNSYQSLYYDGANLFWSRYVEASNKVDIIMVDDLYNDGSVYNAGSFADGVWPVGGLFELGVNPIFGPAGYAEPALDYSDAVILDGAVLHAGTVGIVSEPADPDEEPIDDEEPVNNDEPEPFEEPALEENAAIDGQLALEDPAPIENPAPIEQPVGSLDAAPQTPSGDADPNKLVTEIVVNVTADELLYNGKIEVNFDPATVNLLEAVSAAQFSGCMDRSADLGRYVLAWVDLNGIQEDEVILSLHFSADSEGTVTVTTLEADERDGLSEELMIFLKPYALNPEEGHEHNYQLLRWDWAPDFSSAVAVFQCPDDLATICYEAGIGLGGTEPTCTEPGTVTYTATVEVDGQEYTDTKEKAVNPTGHKYGEPAWEWTKVELLDSYAVVATFTCSACGHEETVNTMATDPVISEPECETPGSAVYTATVEFLGKEYTDTRTDVIEAPGHDWGEPVWTWTGFSSASVSFVCGRDPEHSASVGAEISSVINDDNTVTFTATAELDGQTYTDEKTEAVSGTVCGKTMLFGDKFGGRALIYLSSAVTADKNAYAMLNGQKVLVKKAVTQKVNGKTAYGFDCEIGPKMFNDPITVKLYNGDGQELVLVTTTGLCLPDGYVFKPQDYLNNKIAKSTDPNMVELAKAMSDLGRFAQLVFEYETDKLAPQQLPEIELSAEDLVDYKGKVNAYDSSKIQLVGATMMLESEMLIRVYFQLAEGVDPATLSFTINGAPASLGTKGGAYYLDSPTVPGKSLDQAYSFVVADENGEAILDLEYSGFTYIYGVLVYEASTEDLVSLAKTLYAYNLAAKAYFK